MRDFFLPRLFVATGLLLAALQVALAQDKPITIGVLAYRGEEQAVTRWSPLSDYLSEQIPGHSFIIRPFSLEGLEQAVSFGVLDFILTNPGHYVALQAKHGVSRLVTIRNLRQGKPYTVFGAVIFARTGRTDLARLADLKGKSFMAVDKEAFGGFQMAWREFKDHGIDPFTDFSQLVFHGFPQDDIVYAVRDGAVDAGTVRTDILERMSHEGKINMSDFRVLNPRTHPDFPFSHSTRLYPEWPFAAAHRTDEMLAQKVAVALLTMPMDHPAAETGRYAGWTVPLDYQPVHELFKELQIGPYARLGKVDLGDLVRNYWYWFVLGLAILLLMLFVTIYVMNLNHRLKSEIKQRRRTEAEMRKLSSAVEQTADPVIITDREGLIEYVNPAFERITGFRRDEAIGCKPNIVKSGIHDQEFYKRLWDTITRGEAFRETLVNRRKDGKLFYEEKSITPVRDEKGEIAHFVSSGKDVTERKRAETALQNERNFISAILDIVGALIVVLDTEGRIVRFNRTCEQITGYSFSEVKNLPFWDLFLISEEIDSVKGTFRELQAGHFPNERENYWVTKDKQRRLIHWANTTLVNQNGEVEYIIGTGIDITERRQAEERARQRQEQLAHVARVNTIGEMASGLAHEISQPLTAIVNYTDGCIRRLREERFDPAELLKAMMQVAAQAKRAGDVIQHVRSFITKREPQCLAAEINLVVEQAVALAEIEIAKNGVVIRMDLANDLPAIYVDGIQIQQVILNLLRNATEAMAESAPDTRKLTIRTSLTNGADHNGDGIEVAVSDTGPGLSPESAERIFEPFFTTKPDGMGMGLAISRTIVEAHGGRLWASANPDQGISFCFTLPLEHDYAE